MAKNFLRRRNLINYNKRELDQMLSRCPDTVRGRSDATLLRELISEIDQYAYWSTLIAILFLAQKLKIQG